MGLGMSSLRTYVLPLVTMTTSRALRAQGLLAEM